MGFVEHYQNASQPGNIMMTMGSDFNYANALPWYKNMDKLIEHVNRKHGDTVSLYQRGQYKGGRVEINVDSHWSNIDLLDCMLKKSAQTLFQPCINTV